jgi:hypothetical protein
MTGRFHHFQRLHLWQNCSSGVLFNAIHELRIVPGIKFTELHGFSG